MFEFLIGIFKFSGAVSSSNSSIKVERYAIQRVTGDGRCMFRALVCVFSLSENTIK